MCLPTSWSIRSGRATRRRTSSWPSPYAIKISRQLTIIFWSSVGDALLKASPTLFVIPMKAFRYVFLLSIFALACGQDPGTHLFILSGQSNMARLNPEDSFTPTVQAEFGAENVIVVKDAWGGEPIRRWYKNWKPAEGEAPPTNGDLYDRLMAKVDSAIAGQKLASVTFVWMQGERDARESHGAVYGASLIGLMDQLKQGLGRDDIHMVVGRLSDFDMDNGRYPHWTMIRDVLVHTAEAYPKGAWVDTDDLNDGVNAEGNEIENDLHMSVEGYTLLGQRFADASINLIKE